MNDHVIDYHKWLTTLAAGLAAAALTLPPIAHEEVEWRWPLIVGIVFLATSAWFGIIAVKLATVLVIDVESVPLGPAVHRILEEAGDDERPAVVAAVRDHMANRKKTAGHRFRGYALVQNIGFGIGSVAVGVALVKNLL